MSLFGITALGPPNIFKSSLVNAMGKLSSKYIFDQIIEYLLTFIYNYYRTYSIY